MTAIGLTEALQQVAVQLEPYWQQAAELVLPHVQSVVEAASPYVQQARALSHMPNALGWWASPVWVVHILDTLQF